MKLQLKHNCLEILLALTLGLGSACAFFLPDLAGYATARRTNKVFLGFIRSDDYHRYGSFMEQTKDEKRFLFYDNSAVEPQTPRLLAILFWVFGVVARITHAETATIWILSKLFIAPMLFLSLVYLLRAFFPDNYSLRMLSLWLIAISSGIDTLLAPFLSIPRMKNFWMDGFSTFQLHHNPLKVCALAVGVFMLGLYFRAVHRNKRVGRASTFISCLCFILLWALHPNTAIVIYGVLACSPLVIILSENRKSDLIRHLYFLIPHAIPALCVGLFIFWMRQDAILAHIISCYQVQASEKLYLYLVRYGLLLIPLPWGFLYMKRTKSTPCLLTAIWLFISIATSSLESLTGLLFQHTVHIPLTIISAIGVYQLLIRKSIRTIVVLFSSALFLVSDGITLVQITRQTIKDVWPTSLYVTQDENAALRFLEGQPAGNVLVNRNLGNKVGFLALKRSFLGHWGTTPFRARKEQEYHQFYEASTPLLWKMELMQRYAIRYILCSESENLPNELIAAASLRNLFKSGSVFIYERTNDN